MVGGGTGADWGVSGGGGESPSERCRNKSFSRFLSEFSFPPFPGKRDLGFRSDKKIRYEYFVIIHYSPADNLILGAFCRARRGPRERG